MSRFAPEKEKVLCDAGIVAMTFNHDNSQMAFSPNSHLVYIVEVTGNDSSEWNAIHVLEGHDQAVTGLRWGTKTNKIVSCAQDRTAFVWGYDEKSKTWLPATVLLDAQVKRGLLCADWCFGEEKHVIGTAGSSIAVSWYSAEEGWWDCRVNAAHTSSVTAVAAHPNDATIVATGSTDSTVKIISVYLKSVDGPKEHAVKFGTVLQDFKLRAWVGAVTWAPSGRQLAIASHDSRVTVASANADGTEWTTTAVCLRLLPLRSLLFVSEDALVGGGYDYYPVRLAKKKDDSAWAMNGKWLKVGGATQQSSAAAAARAKFAAEASFGTTKNVELPTKHKNDITCLVPLIGGKSGAYSFATSGMDGRVELWNRDDCVDC